MLLTIDTDNKTVSIKGQVRFCEVYAQLKKMFPDNYKEYSLKQEVETVPYYPYQHIAQPAIYDGWFPAMPYTLQHDPNCYVTANTVATPELITYTNT